MKSLLVFPHQLFEVNLQNFHQYEKIILLEEPLLFGGDGVNPLMHKQKLSLHIASMEEYAAKLAKLGANVKIIRYLQLLNTSIAQVLLDLNIKQAQVYDPVDYYIAKKINLLAKFQIEVTVLPTPYFYITAQQAIDYVNSNPKKIQTDFYIWQRKRLNILMQDSKPVGGKWTYDTDNRKKLPKGLVPPSIPVLERNNIFEQAKSRVLTEFAGAPGNIEQFIWPTNHEQAQAFLTDFLHNRLQNFGAYEDAISSEFEFNYHALLSSSLNIGLLTPEQVISATLNYYVLHPDLPIESIEGFVRQIIGWREFIYAQYLVNGVKMRNSNFFNHQNKLSNVWYEGNSGIAPLDNVIKKLNNFAYAHHIERLMIAGNLMQLAQINPDQAYSWFMEMFIDSYDWVMVPNVYAMSQYADGGQMMTKPYISGSNYILKMSDYKPLPNLDWTEYWDGMYWNFINTHQLQFSKNPRMSLITSQVGKMDSAKLSNHLSNALTGSKILTG